jgi:hypothetical protein
MNLIHFYYLFCGVFVKLSKTNRPIQKHISRKINFVARRTCQNLLTNFEGQKCIQALWLTKAEINSAHSCSSAMSKF